MQKKASRAHPRDNSPIRRIRRDEPPLDLADGWVVLICLGHGARGLTEPECQPDRILELMLGGPNALLLDGLRER